MDLLKGRFWLCNSCLNDDVINSEAKYTPVTDTKNMRSGMKSNQNSLTESKSALEAIPKPVKIHDKENSFSPEVTRNGLVEENDLSIHPSMPTIL